MKTKRSLHRLRGTRRLSLVSNVAAVCVTACGPSVLVVNMMPQMESWEYNMDGEPSIAVDPNSPLRIAATAFTPDPMATSNAPIYRSLDGGQTWFLEAIVPGGNSIIGTHDINVAFSRTTGKLYIADIRGDSPTTLTGLVAILDVLREDDPLLKAPTTLVGGRQNTDQPFLGVGGTQGDILYVGNNYVGS